MTRKLGIACTRRTTVAENGRREEVKAALIPMKDEVRAIIEKHATLASQLSPNFPDPHTPIIVFMQMALAQAAMEYLIVCGLPINETAGQVMNLTGRAMEAWARSLLKLTTPEQQQ